ncbi:SRPBCC family protein [Methylomicrobium sp. Wu6]|uniref:SRPBCC family protein n=1 Tax=Methylomicrobium sp. Wu6 TaxID=3107928 RepID=UPI002DD65917|nr:SRPBCC family protein [Methylomicrobium sp. Wu6]MEC4748342.1 SRPBCC family protein [Methylomicrobium sp. Wu6]
MIKIAILICCLSVGISTIRDFWISPFALFGKRWQTGCSPFSKMRTICPPRRSAWLLLVAIGLPLAGHGAEVLNSSVTLQQGRYMMHSETLIRAPVSKVRDLLMDYKNIPRLNSDIKQLDSVEYLNDGGIRMGVKSAFCILAICLRFDWIQDVRLLPSGDITMTIVQGGGDFRQGNGLWRLLPDGASTRLIYDVDLTPKNRIPLVFGSLFIKQKLSEESFEFAQGLEKMAKSNCY